MLIGTGILSYSYQKSGMVFRDTV